MKFKKKKHSHDNVLFSSSMDYLDRWHFVVALIAFQVVSMLWNEFGPFELFLLYVAVVMQGQI
jgi:hypothetical protein